MDNLLLAAARQKLLELGAVCAGQVPCSRIVFRPEFTQACRQNRCGAYATSWSCPPAADIPALMKAISSAEAALVFQNMHLLEDPFDYPSMELARKDFDALCSAVRDHFPADTTKILGTGPCDVCPACTYPDKPCAHPAQQRWNLEAAGVDVAALCEAAGLPYAEAGQIRYTGLLLFTGPIRPCGLTLYLSSSRKTPPFASKETPTASGGA